MKTKLLIIISLAFLAISLNAKKISSDECGKLGNNYIFAGGECIQFSKSDGDSEGLLNIIVHGTWPAGTNTLGRYSTFAETISMSTDITTIAIALPGYSNSSTNNFSALAHEGVENLAAKDEYIKFLVKLIEALKDKFNAEKITYIGHSAGAMMGATLMGYEANLIQNIVCVGGRYDIHEQVKNSKDLVSIVDVLDKVDKEAKFLLIYGTADKISEPKVTKSFYELAVKKGLDVTLVEIKNAPHLDLDMHDKSVESIIELLEE